MNLNEFRQHMDSYRCSVENEAKELKDSYLALDRLQTLYRKFDSEEQAMADQVITEWALSDDEGLRFDALALIDRFKIATAAAALRDLARRLVSSDSPGAHYERQKVDRILKSLDK